MRLMRFSDTIQKYNEIRTPDGMGGFISTKTPLVSLHCKASLSTRPEDFTAYGINGEQVLYVISPEALDKEAFYLYNDKRFNIRMETHNTRLYYYTFVEIK